MNFVPDRRDSPISRTGDTVPEKHNERDAWPTRDHVSNEDGPHPSRDVPRDSAQDARASKRERRSTDIDPDSAESMVDRDDSVSEG